MRSGNRDLFGIEPFLVGIPPVGGSAYTSATPAAPFAFPSASREERDGRRAADGVRPGVTATHRDASNGGAHRAEPLSAHPADLFPPGGICMQDNPEKKGSPADILPIEQAKFPYFYGV
ncbi:MAG: hypothetical protein D6753_09275, partial [Planctomycetota bacterium]